MGSSILIHHRSCLNLAGCLAWLGFSVATQAHSQPAGLEYESQTPAYSLPRSTSLNDCGLRAVVSVLAEKGLHPDLPTLVNLLRFRYPASGGKPAGEGYSLSDLQWLLQYFGVSSRGFFLPRSSLEKVTQSLILRIPGSAGGHFVVLQSVDAAGRATIYDPSQGVLKVSLVALVSRWVDPTGRGIALVTGDAIATSRDL